MYSPQDKPIQVHLSRVTPCPSEFPPGYYWYGTRRHSPGRPPKWVQKLLNGDAAKLATENDSAVEPEESGAEDSSEAEVNSSPENEHIRTPDPKNELESESDTEMEVVPIVTETLRPAGSGGSDRYSLKRRLTQKTSCRTTASDVGEDMLGVELSWRGG